MYPQQNPYQPAPAWQPPRRWWQHPALIITLLVVFPPAGIALVWLSRWTNRAKIVSTIASALWFVVALSMDPPPEKESDDPKPAVTVTVTVTVTPIPTPPAEPTPTPTPTAPAEPPTPTPTPEPTTEAPTTRAPEPTTQAPKPTTQAPKPTTQAPKPKPTQVTRPPETAEPEPDPEPYYANCTAVRAAGADPIRRGDPGYGSHLDRDGDGIACE
ncbi:excalibur calcium-binding domain-containing protein [Streptomyces roseolus]|uniref:excalibur calcium-binding domain-containing protein n=1 Tax=Streptomyces roseolus TaxID=67358 RepID=UPI0033E29CA3